MESLSPDPEEISLDIGDLKENPIVEIPYQADAYNSDSQEKLMKRVQEVAQTGRRMKDGLAKLRTETDSSQEGEFTDRHKRRGELLEKFRQDLTAQREGLATTLTEVFEEVHRDPDQSASELFEIVAQNSQTYHFDTPQLTAIAEGLLEYEKKHQAVERASAQHPDPAEFFAANFGSPPQGKVEVIKGPMTVNFRCYDPEDYLTAYSGGKEHINEENKARATSSGGAALSHTKIVDLRGSTTIENASSNLRYEDEIGVVSISKRVGFYEEMGTSALQELSAHSQSGDWKLTITDNEPSPGHRRIILTEAENPSEMLFDVDEFFDKQALSFKYTPLHSSKSASADPSDKIYQSFADWSITVNGGRVSIVASNGHYVNLDYKGRGVVKRTPFLRDVAWSHQVIKHEEQHQFNKLFTVSERRVYDLNLLNEILAQEPISSYASDAAAYDLVAYELARRLARNARAIRSDKRARDEILAYYRDGRKVKEISDILSETKENTKSQPGDKDRVPLYDYAAQYDTKVIAGDIALEINFFEKDITNALNLDPTEIHIVSAQDIQPIVRNVFTEEYQQDLRHWTSSVSTLEQKGYDREEVLALLYQYPVYRWPNLTRQMPDKLQAAA